MNEISKTKFNTNNAWGFGGAYGTTTKYDNNIVKREGTQCYRHTGTSHFTEWSFEYLTDANEIEQGIIQGNVKPGNTLYQMEYGVYMDLEHKDLRTDFFPYFVASDKPESEVIEIHTKRHEKQIAQKLVKVTKLFIIK